MPKGRLFLLLLDIFRNYAQLCETRADLRTLSRSVIKLRHALVSLRDYTGRAHARLIRNPVTVVPGTMLTGLGLPSSPTMHRSSWAVRIAVYLGHAHFAVSSYRGLVGAKKTRSPSICRHLVKCKNIVFSPANNFKKGREIWTVMMGITCPKHHKLPLFGPQIMVDAKRNNKYEHKSMSKSMTAASKSIIRHIALKCDTRRGPHCCE